MYRPVFLLIQLFWCLPGLAQQPLEKLENCVYVPTGWADGDSFLVRTAEGKELTVRLYGADCFEWHVSDETDARRLRAQRRYFGISQIGEDAATSIELAKSYGEKAGKHVKSLLARPFTVFTSWADARGDGRFERVYAFVRLEDGRDLASVLVEEGLARAYGVYRGTPNGETKEEYREAIGDLELQAAKMGRGIWARTDWDALPEQRRAQRAEDQEIAIASGTEKAEEGFVIDPNTAARDELQKLPGIGETIANRIIEARPFQTIEDLLRVPGIGDATLDRIRPHLEIR